GISRLPLRRVLYIGKRGFSVDPVAARAALSEEQPPAEDHVLQPEVGGWIAVYGTESAVLPDRLGLRYIRLLLRQPFHEFEPGELEALNADRGDADEVSLGWLDELSSSRTSADHLIDQSARREVRKEIDELRKKGRTGEAKVLEAYL